MPKKALFSIGLVLLPLRASATLLNAADCVGQINSGGSCVLTGSSTGTSSTTLSSRVEDVLIDTTGHRLFVSDNSNNRILIFNLDSNDQLTDRQADFVLGQPDFISSSAPNPPTAASMCDPSGLLLDGSNLYAPDWCNNRVLVFDVTTITNGESATMVLGQSNFTSNGSGCDLNQMNRPEEVATTADKIFVAEHNNHRVLVFNRSTIATGATASGFLGSSDCASGNSQSTFNNPDGIAISGTKLFVTDTSNNRVLIFDITTIDNGENALNVLGQSGYGPSNISARTAQNGLSGPHRSWIAGNFLYVADQANNRVMIWDTSALSDGMNATAVFGQSDFVSGSANRGQSSTQADGISLPLDVAVASNTIFVTDSDNHRVTLYRPIISTSVSNQSTTKGQCKSGVTLDASGTTSTLSGTISCNWTQSSGSSGTFSSATSCKPTYTCSSSGTRVFVPQATALGLIDSATTMTLSVSNSTPTTSASASGDAGSTIQAGNTVTLTGTGSSDPDGDIFTYSWSSTARPAGASTVLLSSTTAASPTFVPDRKGTYTFSLTVNDGDGGTGSTTTSVTVANSAPSVTTATTGSPMVCDSVDLGADITPTDADSDSLSYSWSLVSSPTGTATDCSAFSSLGPLPPILKSKDVEILNATTQNATFTPTVSGDYTFQVTVSDGTDSTTKSVSVTVEALDSIAGGDDATDEDSEASSSSGGCSLIPQSLE